MIQTMNMYHDKFHNPDMVCLLGDNLYKTISEVSEYSIWFDHVARESKAPHYAILGNFEYLLNINKLMLEDMPAADPR